MSVFKTNQNLPSNTKIEEINDMVLEVNGLVQKGIFDVNELSQIFTDISLDREFLRDQGIGNTVSTYTGWSSLKTETGYDIWSFSPFNYAYNAKNQFYFNDKVLAAKGEATSESAVVYDYVYLYDGTGDTYTDDTTEAGTEGGTGFNLMGATDDYLYLGESSTFSGIKFEYQTRGSNYTLGVEYYDSVAGWTVLTANTDNLTDNTSNFASDGAITWSLPATWTTTAVNGQTKYWVRISTSTVPVTTAKVYYIIPGTSVVGLLALSSSEIQAETWAWCSYNATIYVTIRNTGNAAYEGDYFIDSGSSSTNLENFFVSI